MNKIDFKIGQTARPQMIQNYALYIKLVVASQSHLTTYCDVSDDLQDILGSDFKRPFEVVDQLMTMEKLH